MARYALPSEFNIECYDIDTHIVLISNDLDNMKVVDILTINQTVYKMMQVVGNIQITEGVSFLLAGSEKYVTNESNMVM